MRLGACNGYGWRFKTDGCEVGVSFSARKAGVIGALGPDAVHAKAVESINTDTFTGFLKEMRQICKKFVMFLDNLSAHKAARMSEYVKSTGGDVFWRACKCTPQINPMEIQRMVLKNIHVSQICEHL